MSAKRKRAAAPPKTLVPVAELATDSVVLAVKIALQQPLEPGKTNSIWDQHPIAEVREAARPLDPTTTALMSPEERGQAEWDRLQRIRGAYAAFTQRSGLGRQLFERVRCALNRCHSEDELANALLAILQEDVRTLAQQAVAATDSTRGALGAAARAAIYDKARWEVVHHWRACPPDKRKNKRRFARVSKGYVEKSFGVKISMRQIAEEWLKDE